MLTSEIYPPVIDLTPFCDGSSDSALLSKDEVALQLRSACREVGFFQVKTPSLSQALITDAFDATRALFDLPLEVKETASAFRSPLFRGYQGITSDSHSCTPDERATGTQGRLEMKRRDLKESFSIGALGTDSPMHGDNNWPVHDSMAEIVLKLQAYWDVIYEVALQVSRCLALSLGLVEDFFTTNMTNPVAQMVLLRYPPPLVGADGVPLQPGCGAHTDCGFLTLLVQDKQLDALQIQNNDGCWVDAAQIDGHVLCNLGDMAERWSNNYYKSTWHRVQNLSGRQRHSIPFFCNLNFDTVVDPRTSVCQGKIRLLRVIWVTRVIRSSFTALTSPPWSLREYEI